MTVKPLDCLHSRVAIHFDEGEASRTTRLAVSDYGGRLYRSDLREQVGKLIFCRLIRQVSYEYSHSTLLIFFV
jgi:hypothetical protein